MHAWACGRGVEVAKRSDPLRVWRVRVDVNHLGLDASLAQVRRGLSARPIGTATRGFRFNCVASAALSQGTDFVAGAELSQGQAQMSWQAPHFAKSGTYCVAGVEVLQGQ